MITIYEARDGTLKAQTGLPRVTEESVWIDLLNPTPEEEEIIERALDMDVPTREELQEIEASSRLFQDDGSYFMTATLVFKGGATEAQVTAQLDHPNIVPVHDADLLGDEDSCYSMKLVSGATLGEILASSAAARAHREALPDALRLDALHAPLLVVRM